MMVWWPLGRGRRVYWSFEPVQSLVRDPRDRGVSLRARTPESESSWSPLSGHTPDNNKEVSGVRRIRNRVAGLDVHRDSVTGCVECFDGVDVETTKQRFSTTARGIRELAEWLATFEVELVVMEATGVYWKPVFYGLRISLTRCGW